jgi:hypothetical protein
MSTDEPRKESIEELIERSSLGSRGARQLRSRTSREELDAVRELRRQDSGRGAPLTARPDDLQPPTPALIDFAESYESISAPARLNSLKWLPVDKLESLAVKAHQVSAARLIWHRAITIMSIEKMGPEAAEERLDQLEDLAAIARTEDRSGAFLAREFLRVSREIESIYETVRDAGADGHRYSAVTLWIAAWDLVEVTHHDLVQSLASAIWSLDQAVRPLMRESYTKPEAESIRILMNLLRGLSADRIVAALSQEEDDAINKRSSVKGPIQFAKADKPTPLETVTLNTFHHQLSRATFRILRQARNMNDADLRSVELTDIPLDNIQWSELTRWPALWTDEIRARSVEIAPGFFEIRRGSLQFSAVATDEL